jgi:xylulokinase
LEVSNDPAMVAGVDSSTQSCKIVVCDLESGQIVRTARAAHPDGTEVSADAWLRAFQEATADPGLLQGVQALAVGGQQHGMVTLDDSGELVRDALLWNDNRSAQMRLTSSPSWAGRKRGRMRSALCPSRP